MVTWGIAMIGESSGSEDVLARVAALENVAVPLLAASFALNAVLLLVCLRSLVRRTPGASANKQAAPCALDALEKRSKRPPPPKPVISSLTAAVDTLKSHSDNHRYLAAGELLDELKKALSSASDGWGSWGAAEAQRALDALLADGKLEGRIATSRTAIADMTDNDGFEVVQSNEKMKVLQRLTDDRVLSVKIEAVLDGVRASDCIMIWREASLYPEWFPFVSGGKTLHDPDPREGIINLIVETFFMSVDMVLWGWACDNLAESGELLMCVRPVNEKTRLPAGISYPPFGGTHGKIFGTFRARAVIDILVEPLSPTSTRFAFVMSDKISALVPSWAINYVVQNAMVNIFAQMNKVATKMYNKDPQSAHYAFVNRPAYAHTKAWVEERIGPNAPVLQGKA